MIVNRDGGTAAKLGDALVPELEKAFAQAGAVAEIAAVEAGQIPRAIEESAEAGRVVVAGGDGTAASAAQALAGRDVELGLLPLGTLNHLARDLGIPTDLPAAAQVAVAGRATRIASGA